MVAGGRVGPSSIFVLEWLPVLWLMQTGDFSEASQRFVSPHSSLMPDMGCVGRGEQLE